MLRMIIKPTQAEVEAVLTAPDAGPLSMTEIAYRVALLQGVDPGDLVTSDQIQKAVSHYTLKNLLAAMTVNGLAVRTSAFRRGQNRPVWESREAHAARMQAEDEQRQAALMAKAQHGAWAELAARHDEEYAELLAVHLAALAPAGSA
ncbi:hypothetical protein [Kitasatospora viridis]|uniref:Uncharacterized protein n=1 Tax=Kitasatospora viridis TaxID=281105 RepID=A0A561SA25_9ACTN|nr:hypothetical protein [Kitasatospora viridis]TWF71729.1 hypothetical protein FHX73_18100 [Kitasatospora viridis]